MGSNLKNSLWVLVSVSAAFQVGNNFVEGLIPLFELVVGDLDNCNFGRGQMHNYRRQLRNQNNYQFSYLMSCQPDKHVF